MDSYQKQTNELISGFMEESHDSLKSALELIPNLLAEKNTKSVIDEVFRITHSLKGNSSLLGFTHLKEISHHLEMILSIYRENPDKLETLGIALIKKSLVFLQRNIDGVLDPNLVLSREKEYASLLKELIDKNTTIRNKTQFELWNELIDQIFSFDQLLGAEDSNILMPWRNILKKINSIFNDLVRLNIIPPDAHADSKTFESMKSSILQILEENDLEAMTQSSTEKLISLLKTLRDFTTGDSLTTINETIRLVNETVQIEGFSEFLGEIVKDRITQVTPNTRKSESMCKPIDSIIARNSTNAKSSKTIRIAEENFRKIITLFSELIITNEIFTHIYKRLETKHEGRESTLALKKNTETLNGVIDRMQNELAEISKVPVSLLTEKAHSIIQENLTRLHKNIKLTVSGEGLLIDKFLYEKIQDPFIHLIRNAVDHGIEPVEIRNQKNKPDPGTLEIIVSENDIHLNMEIYDDGNGIDAEEIAQKAVKRKIITAEDCLQLSESQKIHLITLPGFSLLDNPTELSGMGVGMDVVNKNISDLGGTLEIQSRKGEFTRFKMLIPKTAMIKIMNGFLVSSNDKTYILPMESVRESFVCNLSDLHQMPCGENYINYHGNVYQAIDINELMNETTKTNSLKKIALFVETLNQSVVLIADEIIGTQQVVIKNANGLRTFSPLISGFAVLGNEKIAILINIEKILKTKETFLYVG